jgi:hypothetical protein
MVDKLLVSKTENIFGIFDGRTNDEISQYSKSEFFKVFIDTSKYHKPREALGFAFREVEARIIEAFLPNMEHFF